MHFSIKKTIIVILAFGLIFNLNIYSADYSQDVSGYVINSPLFNNFEGNELDAINIESQTFNQQLGLPNIIKEIDPSVLLLQAISDSNYPITPGDTFRIDYQDGDEQKQLLLQVDSKFMVNIPLIGVIDAENMTLNSLTSKIQNNISTYYSFSFPQATLVSLGVFAVQVTGEVVSSSTYLANGLSKLSHVVNVASFNANTRDIEIKDRNGEIKHYDLYLALKKGQTDQNPLLKVGDTVILKPSQRVVNVNGNVYKAGTYQLKGYETLSIILNEYCGGLFPSADKKNIIISRYDSEKNIYQEIKTSYNSYIEINNLDKIIAPSIKIEKNSIRLEGAIKDTSTNNSTTASLLGMARGFLIYNFFPGENLELMLETISPRFTSTSDLLNSYLLRNGETINIDILSYLTKDVEDNFALQAGDKIVIPFDQKFVNVQGAVARASAYAYEPDKKISYYIALAGGLSQDADDKITIKDKDGKKIGTDSYIPSEATIHVEKNTFSTDVATVASVLAIVTASLALINAVIGLF